jgi:SAM-dependent methyltransferase
VDAAEFDKFADEYRALHARNIRASGEPPEFFAEYKVKDVSDALAARRRAVGAILDFGGGIGTSVPYFRRYFPAARLTCLDVSRKSLELARRSYGGAAAFVGFDGERIPFDSGTFDVAFAACVFHHIDQAEHVGLLGELRRVLTRGGALFVFEHNPLNPLTRRAVNSCAFDENAHLITAGRMTRRARAAGFDDVSVRYRIFFPRILAGLRPVERFLAAIPLGAQYYVVCRKG